MHLFSRSSKQVETIAVENQKDTTVLLAAALKLDDDYTHYNKCQMWYNRMVPKKEKDE